MVVRRMILLVALAACSSKRDREPSDQVPGCGSGGSVSGPLAVTLHCRAQPNVAYVSRTPTGELRVLLGEHAACGAQNAISVALVQRLARDGAETWVVRSVAVFGQDFVAPDAGATVAVRGEPQTGGAVDLALSVSATGSFSTRVEIHGTTVAKGCGDEKLPAALPAPARSTATMTVAGKRIAIRGAVRRGRIVELSDLPRGCDAVAPGGVTLVAGPDSQWTLKGHRFTAPSYGEAPLSIKQIPGAPDRDFLVRLQLAGSGTIGGYPVAVDGDVDAIDCGATRFAKTPVEIVPSAHTASGARGPRAPEDGDQSIGCQGAREGHWLCFAFDAVGDGATCEARHRIMIDTARNSSSAPNLEFTWDRGGECTSIAYH